MGILEEMMARVPGGKYLSPEEQQGALALALLQAGAGALQGSQGTMQGPGTFGGAMSGAMSGFAGGLQNAAQQGLVGAYTGAKTQGQLANANKDNVEAALKVARQQAMIKYASGDRSPQVMAMAFPDEYGKSQFAGANAMASKGMVQGPDGKWTYAPGVAESDVALAGGKAQAQAQAEAPYKTVAVAPGGTVITPFAGGGAPTQTAQAPAPGGQFAPLVQKYATDAGVDPTLVGSVLAEESRGNPQAVSPKGARGVMQIMPDTAKDYGIDPTNPEQSIWAGSLLLKNHLIKYKGSEPLALMAYNWGPANVDNWLASGADWNKVPAETKAYLEKIAQRGQSMQQPRASNVAYQDPRPASSSPESKYDQTVGEGLGKLFMTSQEAVKPARSQLRQMEMLDTLLEGIQTGKFGSEKLAMKKAAKSMGLDLAAFGIADDVAPQEAAAAISNQLAMALRNPAGGEGMPGAMSDADRKFLQDSVPGLSSTPEGRKLLIEGKRKLLARLEEEAALFRDYARGRGGRLDAGVYDALADLGKKDIFDQEFRDKAAKVGNIAMVPPLASSRGGAGGKTVAYNPATGRLE